MTTRLLSCIFLSLWSSIANPKSMHLSLGMAVQSCRQNLKALSTTRVGSTTRDGSRPRTQSAALPRVVHAKQRARYQKSHFHLGLKVWIIIWDTYTPEQVECSMLWEQRKGWGFKTENVIHAIANEDSLAFPALAGVGSCWVPMEVAPMQS